MCRTTCYIVLHARYHTPTREGGGRLQGTTGPVRRFAGPRRLVGHQEGDRGVPGPPRGQGMRPCQPWWLGRSAVAPPGRLDVAPP